MCSKQSTSLKLYSGLIVIVAICKLILLTRNAIPVPTLEAPWPVIIAAAGVGLIGVKLSNKAGFPEMFDVRVSQDQRFLFPALLGLAVGGILVIFDLFHPLGIPHIEFPISVAVYVHGGILSEIFFRLFPIPFLVWLISYVFLRNRWQTQAFWIVAALVSLFEPLMQVIALKQHLPLLMGLFGFIYAVNLTSAYFFRRYGFLANLTMRLSTYIIWHMLH